MGDRKRKLGSREAFAVPRIGDGVPFALPLANGMFESPIKAPENVPYSGKGYISTPEKSYSASISNNELAELYSSCIKLATENVSPLFTIPSIANFYCRRLLKKTHGS